MARGERELLQKRILQFYLNSVDRVKSKVVNHFKVEGVHRSTIYSIIKKYEESGCIGDQPRSGRPATVATKTNKRLIKRLFQNKDKISTRIAAARLNISRSSISRLKRRSSGIRSYVKEKAPKYKDGQEARAKTGALHVYRKLVPSGGGKVLILDESYFLKNPSEVLGREYYHCSNKKVVDRQLKIKPTGKFPEKFLVWQAIGVDGNRSEPLIISRHSMNSEIYLKDCIIDRLVPFIKKYYLTDSVLFWPDLATAHYTHAVLDALEAEGIEVVRKEHNPPNLPQARGIERYWALVKAEYRKRTTPPTNLTGFKRMYLIDSAKVTKDTVKRVMRSAIVRLQRIAYNGVYSIY